MKTIMIRSLFLPLTVNTFYSMRTRRGKTPNPFPGRHSHVVYGESGWFHMNHPVSTVSFFVSWRDWLDCRAKAGPRRIVQ